MEPAISPQNYLMTLGCNMYDASVREIYLHQEKSSCIIKRYFRRDPKVTLASHVEHEDICTKKKK